MTLWIVHETPKPPHISHQSLTGKQWANRLLSAASSFGHHPSTIHQIPWVPQLPWPIPLRKSHDLDPKSRNGLHVTSDDAHKNPSIPSLPSGGAWLVACFVLPGTNQASSRTPSSGLVATRGNTSPHPSESPELPQESKQATSKGLKADSSSKWQRNSLKLETLRCITQLNWNLSNIFSYVYIYIHKHVHRLLFNTFSIHPKHLTSSVQFWHFVTFNSSRNLVAAHQKNAIHLQALGSWDWDINLKPSDFNAPKRTGKTPAI